MGTCSSVISSDIEIESRRKREQTNGENNNRGPFEKEQVRSDNDASKLDILGHVVTFFDILGHIGTIRKTFD